MTPNQWAPSAIPTTDTWLTRATSCVSILSPSRNPRAAIWTTVLTLPPRSAATTMPRVAAIMRRPEMRNSRISTSRIISITNTPGRRR